MKSSSIYSVLTVLYLVFLSHVLFAQASLIDVSASMNHRIVVSAGTTIYKRHIYQNNSTVTPFTGNIRFNNEYSGMVSGGVTQGYNLHIVSSTGLLTEVFSNSALGGGISLLPTVTGANAKFETSLLSTPIPPSHYLIVEERLVMSSSDTDRCDFYCNSSLYWDNEELPTLPTYANQINPAGSYDALYTDYIDHMAITGITNGEISLCEGLGVDVLLTGANAYSWSTTTGVTNQSTPAFLYNRVHLSPTTSTVYMIIGTDGLGCSNTLRVTVNVHANPTVNTSPDIILCGSGSSTNLTSTVSGGTPPYSYSWSPASTCSTPTNNSTVVSPSSSSAYQLTVTDNKGCVGSSTTQVDLNPIPDIALNNSTICLGDNRPVVALLIDPISGTTTYSWSADATVTGPSYVPTTPGTYTVTASNGGCVSAPQTYQVFSGATMQQAPGDPISYTMCYGGSDLIDLVFTGQPPFQYSISHADGSVTTHTALSYTETVSFTATEPDVLTLRLISDAQGCTTLANPIQISVNVPPLASSFMYDQNITICSGTTGNINFTVYFTGVAPFYFDMDGVSYTTTANSMYFSFPYPATTTMYQITNFRDRDLSNTCMGSSLGTIQCTVLPLPCTPIPSPCTYTCSILNLSSSTSTICNGSIVNLDLVNTSTETITGNIRGTDMSVIPFSISGGHGLIFPVSPGVSTIYYLSDLISSACDCIIYDGAAAITVWPNPTASLFVTPTYECGVMGNDRAVVTVAGAFPPDGSGAHQYDLNFVSPAIPPVQLINNPMSVFWPTLPTTSITFTLQDVTETFSGCSAPTSVSETITLHPTITFGMVGPDRSICEGESVNLHVAVNNEPSVPYEIHLSDGTIISGYPGGSPYTIGVTPTQTTDYRVVYVYTERCIPVYAGNTLITVKPKPIISGSDISICCSNPDGIPFVVNGAETYEWREVGGVWQSSSTNSIIVDPCVTTQYEVRGVNMHGCVSDAIVITVHVIPNPATPGAVTYTVVGQNVVLSVPAAADASSYHWVLPSSIPIISGEHTSQITVNNKGNEMFFVLVYAQNECGESTCFSSTLVHQNLSFCFNQSGYADFSNFPLGSMPTNFSITPGYLLLGSAPNGILSIPSFVGTPSPYTYTVNIAVDTRSVGCGIQNYSLTLTVNPAPTPLIITSTSNCISGGPVTLTVSPSVPDPGANYTWNLWFVPVNTPSVTGSAAGVYIVDHRSTLTNCSSVTQYEVFSPTTYTRRDTTILMCTGSTTTLQLIPTSPLVPGNSFTWFKGNSPTTCTTPVPGSLDNLSIAAPTSATYVYYRCRVNSCGVNTDHIFKVRRVTTSTELRTSLTAITYSSPATLCSSPTGSNDYGLYIYNISGTTGTGSVKLLTMSGWGVGGAPSNQATITNRLEAHAGLSFQWEYYRASDATWNAIGGSTQEVFTFNPIAMSLPNGALIRCKIFMSDCPSIVTYTNAALYIMHPSVTFATSPCKPTLHWLPNPSASGNCYRPYLNTPPLTATTTVTSSSYLSFTVNSFTPTSAWLIPSAYFTNNYRIKLPAITNFTNATTEVNSCSISAVCPAMRGVQEETTVSGDDKLAVYPNPFAQFFTIKHQEDKGQIFNIQILDMHGKSLLTFQGTLEKFNQSLPDLQSWSSGLYMMQMQDTQSDKRYYVKLQKL